MSFVRTVFGHFLRTFKFKILNSTSSNNGKGPSLALLDLCRTFYVLASKINLPNEREIMRIHKAINNFMLFIVSCAISEAAKALPLIDVAVPSGTVKLQVFQDDKVGGLFWYVPTMVEPVIGADGEPLSEIFRDINQLMFMYRVQASVDE